MTVFKNECVDCGQPCMGKLCPNRNVPYTYCDECGKENRRLFDVYGSEVCRKCRNDMFDFRVAETEDDVFVCKDCGETTDILYDVGGMEVCDECFDSYFPEIND